MKISPGIFHLYMAFVATWIIHGSYWLYLSRKAARLREEARELASQSRGAGTARG